jgi:glycosyltransferase involved in cell wall biosynthesis
MRVLTWHVHGSYLQYLGRAPHEFLLPVTRGRTPPYHGRGAEYWPENIVEVDAADVPNLDLDVVLFQSHRNWTHDQFELLSDEQRALPRVFLEHDPPRASPTDERHPVDDPEVLIVHVTPFNDLMWDCGDSPTRVVDHGVAVADDVRWTGELDRGLVIVNNLDRRGRRLGLDVFEAVREQVPLDLVGMGSERLGGLGEVPLDELHAFAAHYRFLFNPIRWTSLGLAVLEAMATGLPAVALGTTEYATAVENGVSGYVDTNIDTLVGHMRRLIRDRSEARRLGVQARYRTRHRFGIERFARDWDAVLCDAAAKCPLQAVLQPDLIDLSASP